MLHWDHCIMAHVVSITSIKVYHHTKYNLLCTNVTWLINIYAYKLHKIIGWTAKILIQQRTKNCHSDLLIIIGNDKMNLVPTFHSCIVISTLNTEPSAKTKYALNRRTIARAGSMKRPIPLDRPRWPVLPQNKKPTNWWGRQNYAPQKFDPKPRKRHLRPFSELR